TQQRYPALGMLTGGPRFLRGSVLRHSIAEGAADFIAELATGRAVRNQYAESRERQLWEQFKADAATKDYGPWLLQRRSRGSSRGCPARPWLLDRLSYPQSPSTRRPPTSG